MLAERLPVLGSQAGQDLVQLVITGDERRQEVLPCTLAEPDGPLRDTLSEGIFIQGPSPGCVLRGSGVTNLTLRLPDTEIGP